MKKLMLLSFVLVSCGAPQVEEMSVPLIDSTIAYATESVIDTTVVLTHSDSVLVKANTLLVSTKNVDKKVSEIKVLKAENVNLKKELINVKSELQEMKIALSDTTEKANVKKSGFIKRVIDSIKKDTINK